MPSRSEGDVIVPLLEATLDQELEESVPLSQADRRAIFERLHQLVRQLGSQDESRRLKEELRRYKSTLPLFAPDDTTTVAWGVPSGRVFYRPRLREDPPRAAEGQPGHPGRARPLPDPNSPPLRLSLEYCRDCGTTLGPPFEIRRRTISGPPPPEPLVFEVELPRYRCPSCGHRLEPPDPFPPYHQSAFVMISRAIHLNVLGLSVAKVIDRLEEAHAVRVSPAAVLKMENWVAEELGLLQ